MAANTDHGVDELAIGQMVAYPSQGVCLVDHIERKMVGSATVKVYALRVLSDNSTIFVPMANARSVGIRPVIGPKEFEFLIEFLEADFDIIPSDWKVRSREFFEKLQSGDVFAAADVLKKLTFLSHEKRLSFREQNFLEKARFLIVSEITSAGYAPETLFEVKLDELIDCACRRHAEIQPQVSGKLSH